MLFIFVFSAKNYTLKLLFSFILLFSFFLRPATKITVISYYSLNIKSIIKNHCINKAKPELKCNGKCYLKNKLKLNSKDNTDKVKNINFAEAFTPVFLHYTDYYLPNTLIPPKNLITPSNNQNLFGKLILFEIEYPPEYS